MELSLTMLFIVIIVAVIIIFGVTLLFMLSTKKAYSFEHTIDPIPTENNDKSETK